MKHMNMRKLLSVALALVLIAAMALNFAGCSKDDSTGGEKSFTFIVTDLEGNETSFDVTSAKKTVGEALLDEGLIEGSEGDYGLYVTSVNGITADWDKDQTYWAFYVDGDYATAGVDQTDITDGATYSFVLTKG